MWSAGDLSREDLDDLIAGKKTPQQILGMNERLKMGRNEFGDALMFFETGMPEMPTIEAPRFGYSVYDLLDTTLPNKDKWKLENRKYRPDVPPPFREARGHSVSGSVDPMIQIPLAMAGDEAPELARQSQGGRYVEWVNPADGYRYEGVPLPLSLVLDGSYTEPAVSRGIATGTHGLYFDPNDLTGAGREMWDAALTGDIVRRAIKTLEIRDDLSIQKMPHPEARNFGRRMALPSPFKLQGVKNKPMYRKIMAALKDTLGEREMFETFGGGGGLALGFNPSRAVINDINPDIGNLMRRIIREPFQIDPNEHLLGVGESITMPHDTLGDVQVGTMTSELANRFGDKNMTFIPTQFYNWRSELNNLRSKAASGTATPEEYDRMSELFYLMQLTTYNGLVRYRDKDKLPGWDNEYSIPPGISRDKKHLPEQSIEDSFFQQLMDAGLYNPEKSKYSSNIQPGGNTFRPNPLRGGAGPHDFSPWHEAMKDWQWRTGDAMDFYEDVKEQMSADDSILTFDPPYFGEEGAHTFFTEEHQNKLIQQMIDAKERGIPTVVFNSMHPSIVDPLREAGFDIHTLGRQDMSGASAETRGTVGELMAMANVPQDAFMQAWQQSQQGNDRNQQTLF